MDFTAFQVWLGIGIICVLAEFLLPGLVVIFLGLGALTSALAIHLEMADSLVTQLTIFFISSLIYIFTLRALIIQFFPTDSVKATIDEDELAIGQEAVVTEPILSGKVGRIDYSDSTWKARSCDQVEILEGDQVKIVGRENITWIVEKIKRD